MEKWLEAKTVATWIIIALTTVIFLTFLIVKLFYFNFKQQIEIRLKESENKLEYQRKLVETSIMVQERERDRIAADLHDSLIGKINAIRLKNQLKYDFQDLNQSLEETMNEARRISHDLSPPMLDFTDIDEVVENMISPWKSYLKITYYKAINSGSYQRTELKLQITRIIQELMMNIYKHSEASQVIVNLKITNNRLILLLRDDGKGFDVTKASKGLGMRNIELRVSYLKGLYKIKSGSRGTSSIFVFQF